MLSIVWISLALAGEVTADVDGSVVRGTALVAVPPERILAEMKDPTWIGRVSGSNTQVTVTGTKGRCQSVSYLSPNAIIDAAYDVTRCPTADGWVGTLVSSTVFSDYRTQWRVVPHGDGAKMTYEVDLTTSLMWVPNSLVRSQTKASVRKMMQAMVDWADAQPKVEPAPKGESAAEPATP